MLLSSLAACGDNGSGGTVGVDRLSEDDAKTALLTSKNVGDGFKLSDEDDDEDDSSAGCLDSLEDLESPDAPTNVERGFEYDDEFGLPSVGSLVMSFDKMGDATGVFDDLRDALEGCTSVDETDQDGAHIDLKVTVDSEKSSKFVDEQFNLVARGTISSEGFEFPMGIWYSVSRLDNHVAGVGLVALDEEFGDSIDEYVTVAVERLHAVASGDEPDDSAVVAAGTPDGDDETDEDEGEGNFTKLPLDGGKYTWDSGVTMTLAVERVEPWGKKDDFCGDGSCGIANPDDTRFVLKYEVQVPADAAEPFDASSCPGELKVTSGNDDEALSGVAGDYDKSLSGKIFPGQTKFGVAEYYIEKAYVAEEFYIESTCGDTDFSSESAYFVGPIKKTA